MWNIKETFNGTYRDFAEYFYVLKFIIDFVLSKLGEKLKSFNCIRRDWRKYDIFCKK